MDEKRHRKLAAILVADAAGYRRLMGKDEVRILDLLRPYRKELTILKIAAHEGKIVTVTQKPESLAEVDTIWTQWRHNQRIPSKIIVIRHDVSEH